MKKTLLILTLGAGIGLFSCTSQAPKANLKTDMDSLSYAAGMDYTNGLQDYLFGQLGLDSSYMNDFLKGFIEGSQKTSQKDIAYLTGMSIGQQTVTNNLDHMSMMYFGADSTLKIDKDNFLAGFIESVKGNARMESEDAAAYMREQIETIRERATAEKYGDYRAENEAFLEENKGKAGVETTPSGLQYKVIKEGKGPKPVSTDRVTVNYKGTLIDGTQFDANDGMTFRLDQVIRGWTEGVALMPVGSVYEFYIPQDLAYGPNQQGIIQPFSTLVFEVELVRIEK